MTKYRQPAITVDAIIIHEDRVALIKRRNPPYKDHFALPGGFIEYGETAENACKREAKEETGLDVEIIDLVGVYSDPKRDPRGHTITIAYLCKPRSVDIKAGSDAKSAMWIPISDVIQGKIKLAFDHDKILKDALKKYGR
ncbi:MAG: NUDIX domain-containing protein [Candidatus Njordarchaeia archaeon]